MRVIAGSLKGRIFHEPKGHKTHPMSDKIRGALFNALGDIEGLTFLDAFAGSGALSFEAISRGADNVIAIEHDRQAQRAIDENIKELKLAKKVHAVHASTGGWSLHNMERKYDILLLDPPYDDLQLNLITRLVKRHAKTGGLIVLSYPGKQGPPKLDRSEVVAHKKYGDSQLIFYRKSA